MFSVDINLKVLVFYLVRNIEIKYFKIGEEIIVVRVVGMKKFNWFINVYFYFVW